MTFALPFVFLNKFVPMITNISFSDMIWYNTVMMIFDISLLPIAGVLAKRFGVVNWMLTMSFLLMVSSMPLFVLISTVSFWNIMLIKFWFVVVGVGLSAPLKSWLFYLIPTSERYIVSGIGGAIGAGILGRHTTTVCWALWYQTNSVLGPSMYITFLSFLGFVALYMQKRSRVNLH